MTSSDNIQSTIFDIAMPGWEEKARLHFTNGEGAFTCKAVDAWSHEEINRLANLIDETYVADETVDAYVDINDDEYTIPQQIAEAILEQFALGNNDASMDLAHHAGLAVSISGVALQLTPFE